LQDATAEHGSEPEMRFLWPRLEWLPDAFCAGSFAAVQNAGRAHARRSEDRLRMNLRAKVRSVVWWRGGMGTLLSFVSFAVTGLGCSSSSSSPPTQTDLTYGGSNDSAGAGGSSAGDSPGVGGSIAPFGGPPTAGSSNFPPPPGGGRPG